MSDYGDYNGDTVHDMWTDYTYHESTGELVGWFVGSGSGRSPSAGRSSGNSLPKSTKQLITECKSRIGSYKAQIDRFEAQIEQIKNAPQKSKDTPWLLNVFFPDRLASYRKRLDKEESKLTLLLMEQEKKRNILTIALCILAIIVSLVIFHLVYLP